MMEGEEGVKKKSPERLYSEIQRDLRRGDSDLKCYASETQANLIKQHTTIDNYRNKNNVLKEHIVRL